MVFYSIKIKTVLVFIAILLGSCASVGQFRNPKQGVYLSAKDFNEDRINYMPIEGKKYKLLHNHILWPGAIKVIIGDTAYLLRKDSVFGYRDNDNKVYRLYNNSSYEVLNPGEQVLLYADYVFGGYKNTQVLLRYYFSKNAGAPIQVLSKLNLKTAFPSDTVFHELLDIYFTTDKQLITYDRFYKVYKINRLYQISHTHLPYFKNK